MFDWTESGLLSTSVEPFLHNYYKRCYIIVKCDKYHPYICISIPCQFLFFCLRIHTLSVSVSVYIYIYIYTPEVPRSFRSDQEHNYLEPWNVDAIQYIHSVVVYTLLIVFQVSLLLLKPIYIYIYIYIYIVISMFLHSYNVYIVLDWKLS